MQNTGKAQAVVITGAGGGLCAAYAQYLAARGAAVVVNDKHAAAAQGIANKITAAGARALVVAGDVGDWNVAQTLGAGQHPLGLSIASAGH